MFLGFITSHRFEKKVSTLDVEIKNLKLKLEIVRWMKSKASKSPS